MHDKEFGLIYNRARYLHSTLGRFTQRDPLGYVDGMNLYEYVKSNPVNYLDPTGRNVGGDMCPVCHLPKDMCQCYSREPNGKGRRKPNISELEKLLKAKCNRKKCCSDCSKTECEAEAKKITIALQNLINRNMYQGPHGNLNARGNYMCWDWAYYFKRTVDSINLKCFKPSLSYIVYDKKLNWYQKILQYIGTNLYGHDNEPPLKSHFWLRLEVKRKNDSKAPDDCSRKKNKGKDECSVAVDDGWINPNDKWDWVHPYPIDKYFEGKDGLCYNPDSLGTCGKKPAPMK